MTKWGYFFFQCCLICIPMYMKNLIASHPQYWGCNVRTQVMYVCSHFAQYLEVEYCSIPAACGYGPCTVP